MCDLVALTHQCKLISFLYLIKFNSNKSVVMRSGSRFDAACAALSLSVCDLKIVSSIKYLGVCLVAGKCFECSVDHVNLKFYSF